MVILAAIAAAVAIPTVVALVRKPARPPGGETVDNGKPKKKPGSFAEEVENFPGADFVPPGVRDAIAKVGQFVLDAGAADNSHAVLDVQTGGMFGDALGRKIDLLKGDGPERYAEESMSVAEQQVWSQTFVETFGDVAAANAMVDAVKTSGAPTTTVVSQVTNTTQIFETSGRHAQEVAALPKPPPAPRNTYDLSDAERALYDFAKGE